MSYTVVLVAQSCVLYCCVSCSVMSYIDVLVAQSCVLYDVSGAQWRGLHGESDGQLWHIHEAAEGDCHRLPVHLPPRLPCGQHARTLSTRVLLQSTGQCHVSEESLSCVICVSVVGDMSVKSMCMCQCITVIHISAVLNWCRAWFQGAYSSIGKYHL